MRIALVSEQIHPHPGPVSEHVHQLARHLAARGHQVRLITGGEGGEAISLRREVVRIGRSVALGGRRVTVGLGLEARMEEALRGCDLVHVHEPLSPILPCLALKLARVPTVGTFHDRPGRFLHGYAAALDCAIATSAPLARALKKLVTCQVIPSGVDCAAWTSFAVEKPAIAVVGPDRKTAWEACARVGAPVVLLNENMPAAERARLLGAAQLMVYTGCAAAPLLEGLAAGLPIVAYDVEGVRELVFEGRQGYKVPAGDAGAVAEALERLLGDERERRRMSCEALKQASRYDWRWMGARIERVYASLRRARCSA